MTGAAFVKRADEPEERLGIVLIHSWGFRRRSVVVYFLITGREWLGTAGRKRHLRQADSNQAL
jgi:hypothetical protein